MSARALYDGRIEPTAAPPTASSPPSPYRFREELWREYRLEAIRAGLSLAQAAEYASALSPKVGLVEGIAAMAPTGRAWFYQGRSWVVKRTIASGLLALRRWEKGRSAGRAAASGIPIFAPRSRPWNAGEEH